MIWILVKDSRVEYNYRVVIIKTLAEFYESKVTRETVRNVEGYRAVGSCDYEVTVRGFKIQFFGRSYSECSYAFPHIVLCTQTLIRRLKRRF